MKMNLDEDQGRVRYLAGQRRQARKKRTRGKKSSTGAATTPVINQLIKMPYMKRGAEAHATFIEGTLPPRDRE